MEYINIIQQKIFTLDDLKRRVNSWKHFGLKVGFTNGCFDILHEGHISTLSNAANAAQKLIIAVNSDASVKQLKGETRPINNEHSRALLLASLVMVDAVIIFNEETPYNLITQLLPNVLIKGGDYTIDQIVGAKEVIENGGEVVINPTVAGFSTTNIIAKMSK